MKDLTHLAASGGEDRASRDRTPPPGVAAECRFGKQTGVQTTWGAVIAVAQNGNKIDLNKSAT